MITAAGYNLPHRVYGPNLKHDGVQWVASFGEGPDTLSAAGDSPNEALVAFDHEWMGLEQHPEEGD